MVLLLMFLILNLKNHLEIQKLKFNFLKTKNKNDYYLL